MPVDGSCGVSLSRHYNATMLVCLLASIGICLSFLPIIPLKLKDWSLELRCVRKVCTVILAFIVFALFGFLLRHRKKLHREGRILWPMRCQHCARLLGLQPKCSTLIATPYRDTTQRRPAASPSSSEVLSSRHGPDRIDSSFSRRYDCTPMPEDPHVIIDDEHSSYGSSQQRERYFTPRNSCCRYGTMDNEDSLVEQTTFSPHRSLVNLFNVFGVLDVVSSLCFVTARFTCGDPVLIILNDNMITLAHVLTVSLAILFFARYHDAVFVATTTNCVVVAVFLSWGLWMSGIAMVSPLQKVMSSFNYEVCHLNYTSEGFKEFAKSMQTMYKECSITSTAIYLQFWNALIPTTALKLHDTNSQHEEMQGKGLSSKLRAVRKSCRSYFYHKTRCLPSQMFTRDESQQLLTGSSTKIWTHVYKTWTILFCIGLIYFIANVTFIEIPINLVKKSKTTILYIIEITYLVPLFILLLNESCTFSQTAFPRKFPKRKFRGHEVLLLLSTCGIFSQNFFRSCAAVGILARKGSLSTDNILLAVAAILYSLVITIIIWLTTAFLLNIQPYSRVNLQRTKWNLYCLIYIIVNNGMEWVIRSFIIEHWVVHSLFFGETTAHVIGVLLEPFSGLYQLHTAMIAYEIYKDIMLEKKKIKQQCHYCSSTCRITVD